MTYLVYKRTWRECPGRGPMNPIPVEHVVGRSDELDVALILASERGLDTWVVEVPS